MDLAVPLSAGAAEDGGGADGSGSEGGDGREYTLFAVVVHVGSVRDHGDARLVWRSPTRACLARRAPTTGTTSRWSAPAATG